LTQPGRKSPKSSLGVALWFYRAARTADAANKREKPASQAGKFMLGMKIVIEVAIQL